MGNFLRGLTVLAVWASLATPASAELIVNGGFETGDFNGWTVNDPDIFVSPDNPHTGKYAAVFGSYITLGSLKQSITTVTGGVYNFSFWLLSPGIPPNEFQALWNDNVIFNQVNITLQPYTQYSFQVTATGNSTTVEFRASNDPNFLLLDDVSVTPIPEPATLGVLGLGGIVLACVLGRRRVLAA
jgi:hypothetical protein